MAFKGMVGKVEVEVEGEVTSVVKRAREARNWGFEEGFRRGRQRKWVSGGFFGGMVGVWGGGLGGEALVRGEGVEEVGCEMREVERGEGGGKR